MTKPDSGTRYPFLDGVRGLGCLWVALGHLLATSSLARRVPAGEEPIWQDAVVYVARGAIPVFFVLSGFVIAHSTRKMELSLSSVARFALRRQLRLDPAYWVALGLAVVDIALRHPPGVEMPSLRRMVSNALYLPWLIHRPALLDVSWTLCLEVQFYLVFILIRAVAAALERRSALPWSTWLIALSGLASLGDRLGEVDDSVPLFVGSWYHFAAGVLLQRAFQGRGSDRSALIMVGATTTAAVATGQRDLLFGSGFAWLLYTAGRRQWLANKLNQSWVQYFGKLSYTLYLTHSLAFAAVFAVGSALTGLSLGWNLLWVGIAALVAVALAQALHFAVERPSIALSARVRGPQKGD